MAKKNISLNETQFRNVVRKTIAKMLSEEWNPVIQNYDSYTNAYEPVVGINNGYLDGKAFDSAGYEYDTAYRDAKDLEDLDRRLAQRKNSINNNARLGQKCHPQATPYNNSVFGYKDGSFNSSSYAHQGKIDTLTGYNDIDDLVNDAVNESLKRVMKESYYEDDEDPYGYDDKMWDNEVVNAVQGKRFNSPEEFLKVVRNFDIPINTFETTLTHSDIPLLDKGVSVIFYPESLGSDKDDPKVGHKGNGWEVNGSIYFEYSEGQYANVNQENVPLKYGMIPWLDNAINEFIDEHFYEIEEKFFN